MRIFRFPTVYGLSWLLVCAACWSSGAGAAEESTAWSRTLDRVSSGVVSIRVDGTRAFDTDWNQSTQATGFVVDAVRGLILTNRHVVTAGPVIAEAVFLDNEEVELFPVYRDPVHDFGLFRYDPAALRFISPHEFRLFPGGAQVGREIRVIGNDAGEQLSILAGTLAKLDRQAPDYGRGKYNDFNTFYLQAASSTSGGSSGSPVIDVDGNVIALNAGASTGAATSFFLPLDRIDRALKLIQAGSHVSRGSLQTVFRSRPFDELRRLGLREDTEARVRASDTELTGMLVVDQVVPGAPASTLLQSGDILINIDDRLVTRFVPLEEILDNRVGEIITVEIQRGGEVRSHQVLVDDLHALSPDEFVQVGDAVVHRLSYQQARHLNLPPVGIYIANPGYLFGSAALPRGSIITELNGRPTPDLDTFVDAIANLGDRVRATVRFISFEDPRSSTLRVIRMDRRWFPAARCKRDDALGYWPCEPLETSAPAYSPKGGSTAFVLNGDQRARKMAPSLVMVNFDMPYTVSGVSERYYHGTGVIIDAERGLVAVDRNTVPEAMGDVAITFAGSLEVPGEVVYIHPLHNLAVVSYDPRLIGDTPVRSARFSDVQVQPGDRLWAIGLRGNHKLVVQATEVASIDAVAFPLSRTFRFRDTNLETITVTNSPDDIDGVLVDKQGRVVSLWSSFAFQGGRELAQVNKGVPAELVSQLVDLAANDRVLYSLEIEFVQIPLASARKLGLTDEWLERLEIHDPKRRQVLQVVRTVAGAPSDKALRSGDLLLAVDGETVSGFREVERAVQKETVEITVWRGSRVDTLGVNTVPLNGHGIDRILMWAGAVLQSPHREMAAQRGVPTKGVYVAYFGYGSPATRYGLWAGRRITEVDGREIADLDAFIATVAGKQDRESVRLKTLTWNNAVEVITLKLDKRYWPTYELLRTESGWERRDLD